MEITQDLEIKKTTWTRGEQMKSKKMIRHKGQIYVSAAPGEQPRGLPVLDGSLLKEMKEALKVIVKASAANEQARQKVDSLLFGSRWPDIQNNAAARSAHAKVREQFEKLSSVSLSINEVYQQLKALSNSLYSAYLHRPDLITGGDASHNGINIQMISYKGAVYKRVAANKCTVEFQDTDRGIDAILLSADGRSLNVVHTGKKTLSEDEKRKLVLKLMAGCEELSKDYKKSPRK